MPPKIKPRPRQSARNNPDTTREHDSVEALSAPSPKEALTNNDIEVQDTSGNAELTGMPDIQIEDSSSRGVSASTPSVVRGASSPRRSVQRLKSALPRNSPNLASNLHGADGLGSRPTGLKFKPKSFIRRSKEEREAEEKAEAERRAARQAAEGTSSTNDRGGYYGRGRARGQRGGFGDMNRWKNERLNLSHEASGHLGGSTIPDAATSKNRRGGGFRSGTSHLSEQAYTDGTARGKKEPNVKPEKDKDADVVMGSPSKPKRTKFKKEEKGPTYISSESELDSDGGERVNIDDISTINLVSSEDDEEEPVQRSRISKGKRREATPRVPSSSLMPVRIQRQEHVERAVGVNTDASSLTSAELRRRAKNRAEAAGSLFLPEQEESDVVSHSKPKVKRKPKDVEFVRDERKWKGVYQEDDDKEGMVKIKAEPKDEREVVMTDKPINEDEVEPIPLGDIESANTSTQRSVKDGDHTLRFGASHENVGEAPEVDTPQSGERLRKIKGYHGRRLVSISEEEEEDNIFAEIAEIALSKSGVSVNSSNPELASSTKAFEEDGDLEMDHEDTYFQQDGREEVYLFQLPPVVPSLRDISKTIPKSEDKKKNKAVPAEVPRSASNNPFAAQVKDEPGIKADPAELPHEIAVPHAYTSDSFPSIGGRGGVLSIHAKGSMFATWGGMSFEITKEGTSAQLAQELMVTEFESAVTKVEDESRWEEKVDVVYEQSPQYSLYESHAVDQGTIIVVDPETKTATRLSLTNFPGPFITHGIDIWSPEDDPDSVYIFAVNHLRNPASALSNASNVPKARSQIELFHHRIGTSTAEHLRSIWHPTIRTPNDIYAINPHAIYFTNDHYYREGVLRSVEDVMTTSRWSNVIHLEISDLNVKDPSQGIKATVAKDAIQNPNGLGHGRNDSEILVGRAAAGIVEIAQRGGQTPALTLIETIQLPITVDNPTYFHDPYAQETGRDTSGYVLAGLARAAKSPSHQDPVSVYLVSASGDRTQKLLFQDDGKAVSTASAAVLIAINPKENGGQKQAWLFVAGYLSESVASSKVDL